MSEDVKTELVIFQMSATPDAEDWILLMGADVPLWVAQDKVVRNMLNGDVVCYDPDTPGYKWYRATICPPLH